MAVTCSLFFLSWCGAASLPPKEQKHFHHSQPKRERISVIANPLCRRGMSPWISGTFYLIRVFIAHHSNNTHKKSPYDGHWLSLWKKDCNLKQMQIQLGGQVGGDEAPSFPHLSLCRLHLHLVVILGCGRKMWMKVMLDAIPPEPHLGFNIPHWATGKLWLSN